MSDELKVLNGIAQSLRHIEMLLAKGGGASQPSSDVEVATERDLRGPYGDPEVRMNPRDWNGASMKGRRMSGCPAEFLDLYAEAKDYFARKADEEHKETAKGQPVSKYEKLDATRARGWAALIRSGAHTVAADAEPATDDGWGAAPPDDDIPF